MITFSKTYGILIPSESAQVLKNIMLMLIKQLMLYRSYIMMKEIQDLKKIKSCGFM